MSRRRTSPTPPGRVWKARFAADFGRFYWKICRRPVSIHPFLTSLLYSTLAEIIPDPNPLMILCFVAILATIACAPLVLRHHWERYHHEVSVAPWLAHLSPACLTSSYPIRKRMVGQNDKIKMR
jgi:hypothetical protein